MKLIEALKIAQRTDAGTTPALQVFLACGFSALHLRTFLTAHLRVRRPEIRPEVSVGLFGDLAGNLERLESSSVGAAVIVLEWADLDARLGIRSLGGWHPAHIQDVVRSAEAVATRLKRAVEVISRKVTTVICTPTLPLPPAFITKPRELGLEEARLHRIVASLSESLSQIPKVRIVNQQKLAECSSPADRYDVRSDLQAGFPYTLHHASVLGELLSGLVETRSPMKAIITDLDDTLWSGIVGDDGVDGISWSLDSHSQMHGVYQQFLSSLASAGVLIGVASKNEKDTVSAAFRRQDLMLSPDDIYPFEVHWSRKSESVGRILKTWNIGEDAVVFIDDNPAEIAEVQAAFPNILCRQFHRDDPRSVWLLLNELRELFGKSEISTEDTLRSKSIRESAVWRDEKNLDGNAVEDFFRSADPRIVLDYGRSYDDKRALELVNKTNQFNLNGKRYGHSEWRTFFDNPNAFLLTATYEDKFGALGKIAVLMGTASAGTIHVHTWVMSCRAFSRRIEHQILRYLFEECGAQQITFEFQPTPRNGPLQDFFVGLLGGHLSNPLMLARTAFFAAAPPLFHRVEVNSHV